MLSAEVLKCPGFQQLVKQNNQHHQRYALLFFFTHDYCYHLKKTAIKTNTKSLESNVHWWKTDTTI